MGNFVLKIIRTVRLRESGQATGNPSGEDGRHARECAAPFRYRLVEKEILKVARLFFGFCNRLAGCSLTRIARLAPRQPHQELTGFE
jgi:hypothetical protein